MASNYVNNEDFMAALVEYKKELKTNPSAQVPEYIGKCILDIAERFSTKPNFYGYSYRDEMVSDAIENCLMYLANFDPEKSKNPFAYFTQICFYAFLRRIHREKKQSYIKHRLIQDLPFDSFDVQDHDDSDLATSFVSYVQSHSSFDGSSFEKNLTKRKKTTPVRSALDDLISEDDDTKEV